MVPYHAADAPAVDPGVVARMKRVHPGLRLTFSPYALDLLNGHPILVEDTGQPVYDPAWYLWLKDSVTSHHIFLNMFSMDEGGFGHRNCESLESDIARRMSPGQIGQWLRAREGSMLAKKQADFRQTQTDKVEANEKRINDLILEGKSGVRDKKVFSYKGQHSRDNVGAVVYKDAKEDGWELPSEQ